MKPSASGTRSDDRNPEYKRPEVTDLGDFSQLTSGSGGSSLDGNFNMSQLGGGNDDSGPH